MIWDALYLNIDKGGGGDDLISSSFKVIFPHEQVIIEETWH